MKLKNVVKLIYEMIWDANDELYNDIISSGVSGDEDRFILEVEGRKYEVVISEIKK